MNALPPSLAIALWLVAATWTVALIAHLFDVPRKIVFITFGLGTLAGDVEWLLIRRRGN